MGFDVQATLSEMIGAAKAVFGQEWPDVQSCVQRALEDQQAFLQQLARARLEGEIDDAMLAQQLRDEERTFAVALLACNVRTKKLAEHAANAAIDVFNQAVATALMVAVGIAPRRPA